MTSLWESYELLSLSSIMSSVELLIWYPDGKLDWRMAFLLLNYWKEVYIAPAEGNGSVSRSKRLPDLRMIVAGSKSRPVIATLGLLDTLCNDGGCVLSSVSRIPYGLIENGSSEDLLT